MTDSNFSALRYFKHQYTMFSDLPGEIIEKIASSIEEVSDFLSFRQVSRKCLANSYAAFGSHYFSTICCDLSKDDMARLMKISKLHQVSGQIRRLVLQIHKKEYPGGNVYGSEFSWSPSTAVNISNIPAEINWLTEILSQQWVNCTSFKLTDENYPREAHKRSPEAGLRPIDVLAILLDIIDKGCLYVTCLTLHLNRRSESLLYEALHPYRFRHDPFQSLWGSSLHYLNLGWHVELDRFTDAICRMIARATGLKRLVLRPRHSSVSNDFLNQLTTALAEKPPRLTELRIIDTAYVQDDVFQGFLSLFTDTLCILKMTGVYVTDWASALHQLRTFPQLRSLPLFRCRASSTTGPIPILFCGLSKIPLSSLQGELRLNRTVRHSSGNLKVLGFSYHGPGLSAALPLIVDATFKANFVPSSRIEPLGQVVNNNDF